MDKKYIFTSESVTEGHPDKVCDRISDAILDQILFQDSESRVACETMITQGQAIISGEITTNANIEYDTIVKKTIQDIGYSIEELGAIDLSEFIVDNTPIEIEGIIQKEERAVIPIELKVFKDSLQKGDVFKELMRQLPRALRKNPVEIDKIKQKTNRILLLKLMNINQDIPIKHDFFKFAKILRKVS